MIADEVAKYLTSLGLGTYGVDVFCNKMPDTPDECVCLYDVNTWRYQPGSALSMDHQGVDIEIRTNDYQSAKTKYKLIHNNLMAFGGYLIAGGQLVTHVDCDVAPNYVGCDQDNRYLWSSRYRLLVESVGDVYRL